jgi:hypothetical protein
VIAVLLDGAERQDDDCLVAIERADLGRSQFFPAHRRPVASGVKTIMAGSACGSIIAPLAAAHGVHPSIIPGRSHKMVAIDLNWFIESRQ